MLDIDRGRLLSSLGRQLAALPNSSPGVTEGYSSSEPKRLLFSIVPHRHLLTLIQ